MESLQEELASVKSDLIKVDAQIQALLENQEFLLNRKKTLELKLKSQSLKQTVDTKWETKDFPWSAELDAKMKEVFNITQLRPMQLQTMNASLHGKDCILIMPTGGGKSLCFQLPAIVSEGVTLVVSPLVALMEDQVMSLQNLNVNAVMLNASVDKNRVNQIMQAMTDKNSDLKLLYVTPEKLAKSKRFMNKLEKMYEMGRLSRLAIDEVHCCSQWGHDFRPDYKFLGIMKRQFPQAPIIGLTATATTKVLQDVQKILNIPDAIIFKASFNRPNLFYEVKIKPPTGKDTIDDIKTVIKRSFDRCSGIIYCFSKKECEEVASELQLRGIKTGCYHADMSASQRSFIHKKWISNDIQVVVATIAFGMGIDKPDVRFVIHHSLSKSMENLYQESGRAGRDDGRAHCIVYFRLQDVFRQSTMVFTEQTGIKNLYNIVEYCIDVERCRRSIYAEHFGEIWDQSHCNNMCDHCADTNITDRYERADVTSQCQHVIEILQQASMGDQRLTANKLLDALESKGHKSLQVKGFDSSKYSRTVLETILAHMLLKGYLKEEFHFTAYSTISYLVQGPRAGSVHRGSEKLFIKLKKLQKLISKTSDLKLKENNSKQVPVNKEPLIKPKKLHLINTEKSAFMSGKKSDSFPSNNDKANPNNSSVQTNKQASFASKDKKNSKKRGAVYISDSDEDLDFGDDYSGMKPALKKRSTEGDSQNNTDMGARMTDDAKFYEEALLIDSDSDF